jgi:hypothetical protein
MGEHMGGSMKRAAWLMMLLGGLGGCASVDGGPGAGPGADPAPWSGASSPAYGGGCASNAPPATVPGATMWTGAPLPMAAPYTSQPPRTVGAAQAMMGRSVPLDMVPQASCNPAALEAAGIRRISDSGAMTPNGLPTIPALPAGGGAYPPGVVAGVGMNVPGMNTPFRVGRTQVRFVGPSGMTVSWFTPGSEAKPGESFKVPFRYNFNQAAIYRLKLSDIQGRPGLDLYPTLEVVPTNSHTADFLAHTAVPVTFTDEDFDQVISGNYVIKVIYLPDPQYQDLANLGGAGEIVSTRLEPGVDPIAQAQSRGSILLVIRMGNTDLEAPNTPSMDAPNPFAPAPKPGLPCPPGLMGGAAPGPMVPYGFGAMGGPGMGGPGGPGMGGPGGPGMPGMGGPGGPMMGGPGMPGMGAMGGPGMPGMGGPGGPMMGGPGMVPPGMMPPGAGPAPSGSPVAIPPGAGGPGVGSMLPPTGGFPGGR